MACYVAVAAASMVYTRLRYIEDDEHEVLWVRLRPQKLPRKYSCIIIACMYHPPKADNGSRREYMITSLDSLLRCYPECGIIVTGDFNQLRDSFLYACIMDMRNWSTLPRVMVPFWTKYGPISRLYMLTLLCYPNWDHLTTGWFYSSLQAIIHWTRHDSDQSNQTYGCY